MCITYANPEDLADEIKLTYRLRNTSIAKKWVKRVIVAQKRYQIDDPRRFYGFGTLEQQQASAVNEINRLVEYIQNQYNIPINRTVKSIEDQDSLNYLHHIFEIQHGLLDVKSENFDLQQTLSKLNIMIHRCESVQRGAYPRHVVTYFGLPKTTVLDNNDYQYFEQGTTFGTVYINYAEIGKTLSDLWMDKDSYIQPNALQPFKHYSADFVVRFWEDTQLNLVDDLYRYYQSNQEYFVKLGYSWDLLSKSIGSIPVADLQDSRDVLQLLESRQFVKAVQFF